MAASPTECGLGYRRHRNLYKATTPPWKETIRNRCYTKFRKARERLVDVFRELPTLSEMKQHSLCLVDEVMDQEWEDLYQKMPGLDQFDQHEICLLEEQIRQELKDEEERLVEEYHLSLVRLQAEEIDQMVESLHRVVCPVCKKNDLQENNSVIHCCCGLRLFNGRETLSLARLSADLHAGLDRHAALCDQDPTFSAKLDALMDRSSLAVYCEACKFGLLCT